MARHAHWLCCLSAQTGSWSVMIHWDVKDCRMVGFSGLFLSLCSLSRCFSSFLSLFFLLVFLLTWWSPQRKRMESSWERSSHMAFKNSYFSLVSLLAPQPMSIYSSVSLHGSSAGTERWPKDGVFPYIFEVHSAAPITQKRKVSEYLLFSAFSLWSHGNASNSLHQTAWHRLSTQLWHYGKSAAVGSYIMAYTKQAKCQGFSQLAAVNPWRFTMGKCWNQRWMTSYRWYDYEMIKSQHCKLKYMNKGTLKTYKANSLEFSKRPRLASINWL